MRLIELGKCLEAAAACLKRADEHSSNARVLRIVWRYSR